MNPDPMTSNQFADAFDIAAPALSREGLARRDAMLIDLVQAMTALHRRRAMRRRAAATACLTAIAMAAALLALSLPRPPEALESGDRAAGHTGVPGVTPAVSEGIGTSSSRPLIVRVSTDPAIVERYIADPPSIVRRVGDEELMRVLAAMDRPAGLIRMGDQVRVTAPVTDAELALRLP